MADTVLYDRDNHVATITYNRPDALNAINAELRQDLNAAWERFRDDEDAWVAIVTGAGRAFCAGADMKDPARLRRHVAGIVLGDPDDQLVRERAGGVEADDRGGERATASATGSRW